MARDYKNAKRSTGKNSGMAQFFLGLGLGLALAVGVHLYDKQSLDKLATKGADKEGSKAGTPAQTPQAPRREDQLDFYEMLPKFEVVVPEKEKDVRRNTPGTQVDKPGAYVLQAGSYRNFADADRIKAMLALQGVTSKVEKVTIEADTWHRVRIGPIRDLKNLDETRRKLREAQIDAIVIKVGD
jgi:cell division protein FtsN